MITLFAVLTAAVGPAPCAQDPLPQESLEQRVEVVAYIDAEEFVLGGEYEFVVSVNMPSGISASESGSPAPFLQLDIPDSIRLLEPELTTYKQLSDNEFLQQPYERLLKTGEASIPFKLVSELAPGDSIEMNVLAYVRGSEEKGEYFFRRRLILPLFPGAEAVLGNDAKSDWGKDKKLLQIGRKAAAFRLPNAAGELIDSAQYLGTSNMIVVTYRAHW